MKGDAKVIELLNETLKNELTAINQYWLHYRMLDNWGVRRLAEYERHESIDEMKHADSLVRADPVPRRPAQFPDARAACGSARRSRKSSAPTSSSSMRRSSSCKGAIVHCEEVRDFVSRELFAIDPRRARKAMSTSSKPSSR